MDFGTVGFKGGNGGMNVVSGWVQSRRGVDGSKMWKLLAEVGEEVVSKLLRKVADGNGSTIGTDFLMARNAVGVDGGMGFAGGQGEEYTGRQGSGKDFVGE